MLFKDPPEIERTEPNQNKAAIDSDRFLTAELHCYLSSIPMPTIVWTKVCLRLICINYALITF